MQEPLRDYIKMIGAAKGAIGARAAALSSLNGAARSLTAKREKLDKLKGRSSKEEAAALTAREVREAESLHSIAKQEYEQVAARVDGEMARFQREKLADFKARAPPRRCPPRLGGRPNLAPRPAAASAARVCGGVCPRSTCSPTHPCPLPLSPAQAMLVGFVTLQLEYSKRMQVPSDTCPRGLHSRHPHALLLSLTAFALRFPPSLTSNTCPPHPTLQSAWRDLLPHLEGISDGPPPSAGGSGGP